MGGSRIRQLAGLTASLRAWWWRGPCPMGMNLVDDPRKMALLDAGYASVR